MFRHRSCSCASSAVFVLLLVVTVVFAQESSIALWRENRNVFLHLHAETYSFVLEVALGEVIADSPSGDFGGQPANTIQNIAVQVSGSVVTSTNPTFASLVSTRPQLEGLEAYFNKSIEMMLQDVRNGDATRVVYDRDFGFPATAQYQISITKLVRLTVSSFVVLTRNAERVRKQLAYDGAWGVWRSQNLISYSFRIRTERDGVSSAEYVVIVQSGMVTGVLDTQLNEVGEGNFKTIDGYFAVLQQAIDIADLSTLVLDFDDKLGFPAYFRFTERQWGTDDEQQSSVANQAHILSQVEQKIYKAKAKASLSGVVIAVAIVVTVGIVFTIGFFAYRFWYIKRQKRRNSASGRSTDVASGDGDDDYDGVSGSGGGGAIPSIYSTRPQPAKEMSAVRSAPTVATTAVPSAAAAAVSGRPVLPGDAPIQHVNYGGGDFETEIEI